MDCGDRYPTCAMDLDHVRGEKAYKVSEAVYRAPNLDSVRVEIAKCDVVCANCHRIRTKARYWSMTFPPQAPRNTASRRTSPVSILDLHGDRAALRRCAAAELARAVPRARPARARGPRLRRWSALSNSRARRLHYSRASRVRGRSGSCATRARGRSVPVIETVAAPADNIPEIADRALDFVCSTMVMEHVPDEMAYLAEIKRILRPGGRAYVTTVFKKPWAWYFRKRDGESMLDTSHLREYTDTETVRDLMTAAGFQVLALECYLLWFPLLDPLLFRLGHRSSGLARPSLLRRCVRRRCRSPATTASRSSSSIPFDRHVLRGLGSSQVRSAALITLLVALAGVSLVVGGGAAAADSAEAARTQLGILGDAQRFAQLTGQRSSIRQSFVGWHQPQSISKLLDQLRPVPMLAIKTGGDRLAARHRPGSGRRVPARVEPGCRGIRSARLRAAHARDERALERVLRLQPRWLIPWRSLLDRRLPKGVRANSAARPRGPGTQAEREAPPPRTARGRRRSPGCPGTHRVEPAGVTEAPTSSPTRHRPTSRATSTWMSSQRSLRPGLQRRVGCEREAVRGDPSKPFALAEWGLWGIDDPAFVDRMAAFVKSHARIEFLVYFNSKPGSIWDLSSKPRSRTAYRRSITPLGG